MTSPRPVDSFELFEDALKASQQAQKDLELNAKSAAKRLECEFATLDDCVKRHRSQLTEYRKLEQMLSDMEAENAHQPALKTKLSELGLQLAVAKSALSTMRLTKPSTNSIFVRLMMGKVNVQMWKHADRLQFKDEYNKFKHRTTFAFMLLPFIQLFVFSHPLLWKFHQIWLLYYYLTLSLRENILLVNGSAIHSWWIYHHYISMSISAIVLLWGDGVLFEHAPQFLYFGLFQGIVMLCQNAYQARRSYVRKTLGKAAQIDIDTTETLVEKPVDLQVLIPMLYVLYIAEIYFGCTFIVSFFTTGRELYQVLAVGLGFLVVGIGNAWTTGVVLVSKNNVRKLKRVLKVRTQSFGELELDKPRTAS